MKASGAGLLVQGVCWGAEGQLPARSGPDGPLGAPGKACFKFNPNLTVWIEPEGI